MTSVASSTRVENAAGGGQRQSSIRESIHNLSRSRRCRRWPVVRDRASKSPPRPSVDKSNNRLGPRADWAEAGARAMRGCDADASGWRRHDDCGRWARGPARRTDLRESAPNQRSPIARPARRRAGSVGGYCDSFLGYLCAGLYRAATNRAASMRCGVRGNLALLYGLRSTIVHLREPIKPLYRLSVMCACP